MGLFDDMEPQGSQASSGLFDDLEAPRRNTGLAGDLGTDLKRGVQQLPGIVTGLLDIPVAAVTGRRMVSEGYDEIGKLTGFQPSKWAEEARQEYSPQRQAAQAEIDQVWEDGTATEIAGAYMSNPGYVAGKVVESLPQMAAGGLAGRAVLGAARGAGLLTAPATAGQAARQAALGAGIGEGAVIAGGTMEQIDDSVDARRAAAASLGAGVIGGALGGMGSRVAQRAGLIDAEGALAGGIQRSASEAPGLTRRMTGGAITEGLLEELPQSVQEQMWQNWAEQNPLMEGAARAGVEGTLAGSALGAGINVIPRGQSTAQTDQSAEGTAPEEQPGTAGPDLIQPTPSAENPAPAPVERPDPANGPLSAAASLLPGAAPQGPEATPAGQQAQSVPASPEEARIREAIADVEMRARLGGMNPVLAAERARLGGELLALQQPAAEQQEHPAIADQRSDFYTAGNGFTSRERDPWVNPANNRSSDPYDRFPGIDQVPPQPLEGELLSDVQGEPAAQPAGQRGIGADARPRLMREGELLGGEVVPQGLRAGLGRGETFDGQNRAMPIQPDTRGVAGADGSSVLEGELLAGDMQPGATRQAIGGRVIEGELSPREQRALATTFKKRGAAELARKSLPAPERFTVEEQGETFRLLPAPTSEAAPNIAPVGAEVTGAAPNIAEPASITGREIDREWSEFTPESGTLAIPRAEMPQIKAEHRGAMVRFLNARGIQHEEQTVPASTLKPTQAEFSRQKVEQAKGFTGGDRAILVSSDGHVVDGRHQWLAKREAGGEVRVIRLKAPIRDLLPMVAEFPSSTQEAGAQPMTIGRQPKAPQRGQRRSVDRDRDSVVQAAIRLGGITSQWRQDTTGDTNGNKNIPGVGALWSDKTGTSLDDMASLLDQHGYVPAGEMDKDGGVSWLQAAIRDELGGRAHYAPDSARQIEQAEQELLNRYAEAVARAIDEREAEYARIEAEYGPDAAADARSFDEAAIAYNEQLDGALEDGREAQDTLIDGESVDQADAARRDDELRQADGRADRAEGENAGEAFGLEQQTEAGLAEQDRQQQARERAEAEARRKAEQKAQADAELNDFTLAGSDRPADMGTARGQNDLFGAQPKAEPARAESSQTETPADKAAVSPETVPAPATTEASNPARSGADPVIDAVADAIAPYLGLRPAQAKRRILRDDPALMDAFAEAYQQVEARQHGPILSDAMFAKTLAEVMVDRVRGRFSATGLIPAESRLGSEPNPAIQAAIQRGDVLGLAALLRDTAPSEAYRVIASRVHKALETIIRSGTEMLVLEGVDSDRGVLGRVMSMGQGGKWTRYIQLSDAGANHEVALHELIHAATDGKLKIADSQEVRDLEAILKVVKDAMFELSSRVDRRRGPLLSPYERHMIEVIGANSGYSNTLSNVKELVAWGLTNPAFQGWLDTIQMPGRERSVWAEFVSAIRSLLGLPASSNSALSELLRISDQLLEGDSKSSQPIPVADQQSADQSDGPTKPKRRTKPAVEKIDDTGDSLYWNRKNPWRGGGLKWEQIAGENEALRAKLVTKARVWAKPDWQAYLDELLPKLPEQQRDAAVLVARLTKQVYDALPAAPKDRSEKGLQAYIEVIERVRSAAEALLQDGERHVVLLNGLTRRSGDILSFVRQAGTMPIFDAVFPEIAAGGRFQRGTPANDRGQVIGNRAIKAMQWSVADAGKALKDIKAGWPASQEAWQKQGMRVLARDTLRAAGVEQLRGVHAAMIYDGRNHLATVRDSEGARREFATQAEAESAAQAELQSWAPFLLLDKRNRLVGGFDSEELAIEAARASVKREVKPTVRETPLADAEIQRAGSERRLAGQNVTADQLRDTFGFRGVNFGKYVPQGERQSHLNRAFDAMHDLAEVLGVPPRAMSLNGMLGLAFGAQGNGGKAAAHFVPGVNEINLTRNAGAGSLAHEWAHALDHYFGVQGGMASKEKPYASHLGPRGAAGELRSEIRTAIVNIGVATRSMEETEEQVRQRAAERVEHARQRQAAYLERNRVAEKVAGNAEAEAALARIMAGEQSEYVELPSRKRNKDYVPADVKTVADAIGFDAAQTVDMHDTVSSLGFALEDQRKHFQKRLVHTSFYKSSQALDGKGKPYWSTPHEMFARSFEAFVLDRLMERGAQNDYLVSPVKRDQGTTDPGYPYPAGLERAAINRAFDTLIGAIETRETEAGVGLYRLGDGAGVSAAEVAAALAASPELSGIQVVQSFEELPLAARIRAKSDGLSPGDMRGVFRPNGQYLVADNLDSLEDAVHTAVHEMVGHLGVRGVLGSELDATLERIYSSEASTTKGRQRIAQIREAYAAPLSRRSAAGQRLMVAEEIIAHLAESGDRPGVLQRFVSKVRAVLRRLFPQVRWTYNDILGLIEQSRQWLRSQRGNGGSSADQRYSTRPAFGEAADFRDQLAKAMRVGGNIDRVLPLGQTPAVYRALGADNLPLSITKDTVLKASNGVKHQVPIEVIEQLPELVADPVMVFASATQQGSLVSLIEAVDRSGKPVIVALQLNSRSGRVMVNRVASLYGKDGISGFIKREVSEGRLRYQHAEKSREWLQSRGLQLPKEGVKHGSGAKVLTEQDVVKQELSPDGIRDRIAAARDEGLFRVGQAAAGDRPGTEAPLDTDDTRYRLAESLRAAFDRATGPTPLDPTDPFAVENRRLREEDRTLWDKAKKVFARHFAPGGLLPKSVFAEKITRDSEFQAVEFDVRHLVGALNRATKQEFGTDLDGLDAAQVERLAESLTGQLDPTLPEASKAAVVAMRQYIDRLSADYLTIIQGRIDELQAKAGSSEQAAQAAKDAQRRFKDALDASTEPALVQALAEQKAALRERKKLKKALKGLKGEAKQAARQAYDAAVQAHERAKNATRQAMPPELRKLERLAGEAAAAAHAARGAQYDAEAEAALYEKIKANIGAYVHRSYQAFDDPQWFKSVPTATLNAARQYLIDGYLAMGETDAEARRMAEVTMGEILKTGTAYDTMEAMISEGKLGAKDLSVLIKRKEIAPEIRALLGEYRDPRLNFAKSATKMGRLIWNQRFLDRVREVGMGSFLFTEGERPADATVQIAGEQSDVYAPLNGLWTFPEVAQAFKDALGKEQMSDLYRTVVRLNGMVKYGKTVLSPTTAMRNWQSAMFFSLGNGHFDLSQMKKSIAAFREQVTQSATGSDLAYLRKLKRLGVVYDTPYAGEMAALLADARMDELLSSKSGTGLKWLRKVNQFAQGFYSFGDDFWKIIGFENEKAGLLAAGMGEAAAEKEAAHRIRSTYPTYSMIGRGIQWLRRFPLVGTFVSFPAEIIRTSANMLRITAADLKSDNPQMRALGRKRAAGMAFVSGAFYALAALTAAAFGVDDDEEEALRDLSPDWSKNSTFLFLGRDDDGKLRSVDLSFLDPYGYWKRPITAMLRDQPWEDAAVSGLGDMVAPFFGADIAVGAIFQVLANQKASGGRVYDENADSVDQLQDIANHMRKALQPGFVSNAERLWLAGSGASREGSGQPYDMRDELVTLLGWRANTLDAKTGLYYRAFDFTDGLSQAKKTLTRELRSVNAVSDGDIREARDAAQRQYNKAFAEMARLVHAAEVSGLSRQEIVKTLRQSNIAQANIFALLQGRVPPMDVGLQAQQRAVQQARVMHGAEHAAEVARRFRVAREMREGM